MKTYYLKIFILFTSKIIFFSISQMEISLNKVIFSPLKQKKILIFSLVTLMKCEQ